jgi:hypothetical protein
MSGQAAAGGNTIRWALRAPALFSSASQFKQEWQRAVIAALAPVASQIQQGAQRAYAGTRFAPAFKVSRESTPITAIRLVNTHPLFNVVEYPTKPHTITAHNALYGWLVFKVNGRWVRKKSVHHPGTKGRLAIDPIFQQAEQAFADALIRATNEMISRGL